LGGQQEKLSFDYHKEGPEEMEKRHKGPEEDVSAT
jgi:hypothetical protein